MPALFYLCNSEIVLRCKFSLYIIPLLKFRWMKVVRGHHMRAFNFFAVNNCFLKAATADGSLPNTWIYLGIIPYPRTSVLGLVETLRNVPLMKKVPYTSKHFKIISLEVGLHKKAQKGPTYIFYKLCWPNLIYTALRDVLNWHEKFCTTSKIY